MAQDFSLGLVEVSGLGHAIIMLDDMLKAGDVEFVATERKLGGRLVTIVVRGELSAVKASVDAGVARAKSCGDKIYKASQVIARPHPEIFPYLHLNEEDDAPKVNTQSAGTHVGAVGAKAKAEKTEKAADAPKAADTVKTAAENAGAASKPRTTTRKTAAKSAAEKKPAAKRTRKTAAKKSEK